MLPYLTTRAVAAIALLALGFALSGSSALSAEDSDDFERTTEAAKQLCNGQITGPPAPKAVEAIIGPCQPRVPKVYEAICANGPTVLFVFTKTEQCICDKPVRKSANCRHQ